MKIVHLTAQGGEDKLQGHPWPLEHDSQRNALLGTALVATRLNLCAGGRLLVSAAARLCMLARCFASQALLGPQTMYASASDSGLRLLPEWRQTR